MNAERQVGGVKIQVAIQDSFSLDGGILWGGVPREKWLKWCKDPFLLDEQNRIKLPSFGFLVTIKNKRILIDTSIGDINKWQKGTQDQFQMENGFNLFNGSMPQPDFVVPSHLHFDHAGGCTKMENGQIVPAFPNALYIFHEQEISHAKSFHPKTRSSYIKETVNGLKALIAQDRVLTMFGNNLSIPEAPEITLIHTRGHTPGHLSFKIESEGQTALIPGALSPTRYHAMIACNVGNDTHALEAADHKMNFLKQANQGNWLVFLEHDPGIVFRVSIDQKQNYQLIPEKP